jgi:hypothetical protein
MAFHRGEEGIVKFTHDTTGTLTVVTGVRSWSLSIEKEALETTAHLATSRDFTGGLVSGSGTMELLYENTAAGEGKGDLIREAITASPSEGGSIAIAELFTVDADGSQGSGSQKFRFEILITGSEFGATVGELQLVSVSFVTKGNITYAAV